LNWTKISQKLYVETDGKSYKTGKQCREQYTCFLNPNLKKYEFLYLEGLGLSSKIISLSVYSKNMVENGH